jgi:hypothetical protein
VRGPPPKDPALRQRRNKTATAAELPGHAILHWPALPAGAWSAEALSWWETLKHSPMRAEFIKADLPALVRMARLFEDLVLLRTKLAQQDPLIDAAAQVIDELRAREAGTATLELMQAVELRTRLNEQLLKLQSQVLKQEAELRAHEQRYGLTPLDRRRLQWELEKRPKRKMPETARLPAGGPDGGETAPVQSDDPRLRLVGT